LSCEVGQDNDGQRTKIVKIGAITVPIRMRMAIRPMAFCGDKMRRFSHVGVAVETLAEAGSLASTIAMDVH
jgi:hypothetical protein